MQIGSYNLLHDMVFGGAALQVRQNVVTSAVQGL